MESVAGMQMRQSQRKDEIVKFRKKIVENQKFPHLLKRIERLGRQEFARSPGRSSRPELRGSYIVHQDTILESRGAGIVCGARQ